MGVTADRGLASPRAPRSRHSERPARASSFASRGRHGAREDGGATDARPKAARGRPRRFVAPPGRRPSAARAVVSGGVPYAVAATFRHLQGARLAAERQGQGLGALIYAAWCMSAARDVGLPRPTATSQSQSQADQRGPQQDHLRRRTRAPEERAVDRRRHRAAGAAPLGHLKAWRGHQHQIDGHPAGHGCSRAATRGARSHHGRGPGAASRRAMKQGSHCCWYAAPRSPH